VLKIAVAIGLSHDGFGPIVFALHRAIGKASGQETKERQDLHLPVEEGGKRFAHVFRPVLVNMLDPGIQPFFRVVNGGLCIPCSQIFFELPGGLQAGQAKRRL
jgi:hypothetical protein